MGTIRTSRFSSFRSFLFIGVACVGCAGALETITELPKEPRRPDGVVIEPPPAVPTANDRVAAGGVVALREPLADKDVEDVVRAYVRGFEREDLEALKQLLSPDAVPLGRAGGRQGLVLAWQTKIQNFEYQRLAGTEVARISQLEKHTFETLGQPGAPTRPPEMKQGDLYIRVPIVIPRGVGSEQLFGDVLVLLLRREDGRLRIVGQADETTN